MAKGKYIELKNGDKPSALIVSYAKSASKEIIDSLKSGQESSAKGGVTPAVVDLISRTIPAVATGLANGHIFQVVGTPALLEGIKAGTHALVQTTGGSLGTVVSTSTGQIAGQLRFAPSSMAPVVAPALTWAVLNGLVGTMQLQRINERLDVITRKLESIQLRQEASELGKVVSAINILNQVLAEFDHVGRLSPLALNRLALAESDIGATLERNKVLLNSFTTKLQSVKRRRGADGAESASVLLQEEGESFVQDLKLLNGLISAQALVFKAQLLHDVSQDPDLVEHRLESVQQFMQDNIDCVSAYPSIKELEEHAKRCVAEMSWFERNITRRSTTKRVKNASGRPIDLQQTASEQSPTPNFAFWQEDGKIHTRLIESGT